MSDGLDEELIALVGEDASSPPPRGASPDAGKSRRSKLLSDSSDEASDDEPANPYPLEGLYKDEEDRAWYVFCSP